MLSVIVLSAEPVFTESVQRINLLVFLKLEQTKMVSGLSLLLNATPFTNFAAIDFPKGCLPLLSVNRICMATDSKNIQ